MGEQRSEEEVLDPQMMRTLLANDRMIRAGQGIARGGGQHAMAAIVGLSVAVGFVVVVARAR